MNKRFTIDGSNELELRLEELCTRVLDGVRGVIPGEKLEALFLGGGYGRGEGGVLRTPQGDRPYNDLEFYVCAAGNEILNQRRYGHALHETAERLSKQAELEVELKLTSLAKLKASPTTMFTYDLALGHRTFYGNDTLFNDQRFTDERQIPLSEGTRLLMNRCTGLLFCKERLENTSFTAADADFIGRNHAKAQLAFGDVLLTAIGQYHWSCQERHRRLKALSDAPDARLSPFPASALRQIYCHHSVGVDFKLHPQNKRGERDTFLPLQIELSSLGRQLFLWVESLRLNHPFDTPGDYAFSELNKCAETNSARNYLINLRAFGPAILLNSRSERYPRERIFNALALLLWESRVINDSHLLRKVQTELRTKATTLPELIKAYVRIWSVFS